MKLKHIRTASILCALSTGARLKILSMDTRLPRE